MNNDDGGSPSVVTNPPPGGRDGARPDTPDTARMHGRRAPDFTLPNQHGEPITLSALRGRPVVLVFFPYAFSRVCVGELADLNSALADLTGPSGARVLGVSVDSRFALRAWAVEQGYRFDLLSDFWPHGAVAREWGVFREDAGHALRGSFFIDARGTVRGSLSSPTGIGRRLDGYRAGLAGLHRPALHRPAGR